MVKLYLECTSGISGDMAVGALLDLGADREELEKVLSTVPAEGFSAKITTVSRSGIRACDFAVLLDPEHENHDHDMEYLYGPDPHHGPGPEWGPHRPPYGHGPGPHHPPYGMYGPGWDPHRPPYDRGPEGRPMPGPEYGRGPGPEWDPHRPPYGPGPRGPWDCPPPPRDDGPGCPPEGPRGHCEPHGPHQEPEPGPGCPPREMGEHVHGLHSEHPHEHRNLSDVYAVIDGTQMTDGARETAKEIFRIVAEAESEVHGLPLEEVHFHEVGAVDSIVDIIAFAVCWEDLRRKENIDEVIVPVLYEGTGTVRCQHGVLPVPVPAVTAIARRKGLRLHLMPDRGEFVTPTGAAIAAALQTSDHLPEEFTIRKTGLGAGKRTYPGRTGMLRAMLIEDVI